MSSPADKSPTAPHYVQEKSYIPLPDTQGSSWDVFPCFKLLPVTGVYPNAHL